MKDQWGELVVLKDKSSSREGEPPGLVLEGVSVAAVTHEALEGMCEARWAQVAGGREGSFLSSQGFSRDAHLMSEAEPL